jgi:hypothetical protein
MSRRSRLSLSIKPRSSALVCCVALMLMYSQVAILAVMATTGACCNGDQCPIHGNHHHSQKSEAPMDCGHSGHDKSKMDSCTMSCCHNVEQSAVHANLYLLTPISLSTSLAPYSAIAFSSAPTKISLVFAPLAPPPKSLVS